MKRRIYFFDGEAARTLLYSNRTLASVTYRKYESLLRARRAGNHKRIVKTITFPAQLYKALTIKSAKFGMHYTEYLRYLVMQDVETELRQLDVASVRMSLRQKI